FDTQVRNSLPPKSKRSHLGTMLSLLANLKPSGVTDVAAGLHQIASMVKGKSLVMVFSDLLGEPEPMLQALHHLRHRGNEAILFHALDEAEVHFPFDGLIEFHDVESPERMTIDARGMRADYLAAVAELQEFLRTECGKSRVDYVPIDTSVNFDKALLEYLIQRQRRLLHSAVA